MRAALLCATIGSLALVSAEKQVMPWLCLERCENDTRIVEKTILSSVSLAKEGYITAISTERYNLGPDSTLVRATNLTDSLQLLRKGGWPSDLPIISMVSSYPYPPQFIDWMRQVFKNPMPFINSLVSEAQKHGFPAFNIDWEPSTGVEPGDAAAYAQFLAFAGKELAKHDIDLTVDVAEWGSLWNFTLLNATAGADVTTFMDMSTYTDDDKYWQPYLDKAVQAFGVEELTVGLESLKTDGTPYPLAELQNRFAALKAKNVQQLGIWRAPIPDDWLPLLRDFLDH